MTIKLLCVGISIDQYVNGTTVYEYVFTNTHGSLYEYYEFGYTPVRNIESKFTLQSYTPNDYTVGKWYEITVT